MNDDAKYLNILAIFHYILGGIIALFSCIPIIHLIVGLCIIFGFLPMEKQHGLEAPLWIFGIFFCAIPAAIILFGWTVSALIIITGRKLQKRKSYMFCLVMAGVECIFCPIGTILGAFTIIVLMKDSVKTLFGANTQPPGMPK